MPLALDKLTDGLSDVFGHPPQLPDSPTPGDLDANRAACARKWADAVEAYAREIVPPSATVTAAAAQLASGLATAFGSSSTIAGMESAFAAFAVALGAGMAGYTPTPPAASVGFAQLFAPVGDPPKYPATQAEAAAKIASGIDKWMRTGTSTLVAPPNTVLVWS